ncbi:6345_t:CDS:2, partial [Acaulospora colombiana]
DISDASSTPTRLQRKEQTTNLEYPGLINMCRAFSLSSAGSPSFESSELDPTACVMRCEVVVVRVGRALGPSIGAKDRVWLWSNVNKRQRHATHHLQGSPEQWNARISNTSIVWDRAPLYEHKNDIGIVSSLIVLFSVR